MPDLLLELLSEEIPARMQAQAAADLKKLVGDALADHGLFGEDKVTHVTPRRLMLHIVGLPARQSDQIEEKKGPRVGAPEAAVQGFLKSAGLTSLDQAMIETDPKKGSFYSAKIERKGRTTLDILADILPGILTSFPWHKSMRWGAASAKPDALRWVRPLTSIVCTFGSEMEEPQIVPFEVGGIRSGNQTRGHRFMAPDIITVRRFDDYASALQNAKVVLDAGRRRDIILNEARQLAFAQGLDLVEDEGLLAEVAGLVEWPVVLMGQFDRRFLDLPPEVIRTTIRANQKCFVVRDNKGALSNHFILVSNLVASDGGAAIIAGNERVVRARLSDAAFFWESDLKLKLEDRLPKLESIIFHEKLGTQAQRVARISVLAWLIAPDVSADRNLAERAAKLCKADLVTEMVGEFPELQGLIGARYAKAQGEHGSVVAAIEDHYRPQGPSDSVPRNPVAIAVALADKLDTLVGFWLIDEKPTGSKDPYALRRAALGVVRIVLENGLNLNMPLLFSSAREAYKHQDSPAEAAYRQRHITDYQNKENYQELSGEDAVNAAFDTITVKELKDFFVQRMKVQLKDKGARHDLVDAIFALEGQDDLLKIVQRVEALAGFLDTPDGQNLLAGYRRGANILKAEEKKDGEGAFAIAHDPALLTEPEEEALAMAISTAEAETSGRLTTGDYAKAMQALSLLRAPVDAFFDKVTVNAPDPALRLNRLRLLNSLRQTMNSVADFSKISG